ncbi:MAG: methionine--tRNA ligase, partial [Rhizobiaceae bacterium]
ALGTARSEMALQSIHVALGEIIAVSSEANRYFDTQAPWTLRKTDPARFETVLYVTVETIRRLATLLQPFIPQSADKVLELMAVPNEKRTFAFASADGALVAGTALPAPAGVFPRYADGESKA